MTDAAEMPRRRPGRPVGSVYSRGRPHRPVSLEGNPSAEELAQAAERHTGDDADRFTIYRPDQIEAESRPVRLDITFGDIIKVRDQAEMIMACMRLIVERTRDRKLGSVRLRIDCRAEAASLGRALNRLNGKTPYGERPKKEARR